MLQDDEFPGEGLTHAEGQADTAVVIRSLEKMLSTNPGGMMYVLRELTATSGQSWVTALAALKTGEITRFLRAAETSTPPPPAQGRVELVVHQGSLKDPKTQIQNVDYKDEFAPRAKTNLHVTAEKFNEVQARRHQPK